MALQISKTGGALHSLYDPRDFIFDRRRLNTGQNYVIPADQAFPIMDQGSGNQEAPCCVSCSVTAAMELVAALDGPLPPLSPLYQYYTCRSNPNQLISIDLRTALASLIANGICTQRMHDYAITPQNAIQPPSPQAQKEAGDFRDAVIVAKSRGYLFCDGSNWVRLWQAALQRNLPVMLRLGITDGYLAMTAADPVHAPPTQPATGYHCVTAVGYGPKSFLIRDSRGTSWVAGGYWWLPFDLVPTNLVPEAAIIDTVQPTNNNND